MHLNTSPAAAHRSAETSRRRGACRNPTRQTAALAEPRRAAAARRIRRDDAIVSQWLLEQVPTDHRHAVPQTV